jgi:hypothetical protein
MMQWQTTDEVLRNINELSSRDDCNLVSIKELFNRLDAGSATSDSAFSYLDELKDKGEIEDLSESSGGWGRDKSGSQVSFGKIIRKI